MVAVVEEISRSQFKEVLENAVSRAVGGDTEGGTGRFAQVSGFSFEWSESVSPRSSIRTVQSKSPARVFRRRCWMAARSSFTREGSLRSGLDRGHYRLPGPRR